MTPAEWSAVKEILSGALECPPADRSTFVEKACGADAQLRRRVEALIAANDETWSLLQGPAAASSSLLSSSRQPAPGDRIGAYELLGEIGHGGMGTVYLGQRADEEYRKRVAVKIVRRGMDTDFVLRRFRMERQILAALDHPNIARLIDGGSTGDGLPYFVLEHVEGQPLPEFCDGRRLSISDRLKLFLDVCSAVQFAHRNLVVHRDLKPANILVTKDGVVKLLDFGIAKLLNPDLAEQTVDQTGSVLRLMTPDYASPEQVKGEPITTSSDIYSLGVVLYELLTGHRPYRVHTSEPGELARVVCQKEPEKPSTAVTWVERLPATDAGEPSAVTPETVSTARGSEPARLRRLLQGDLDNIVLMALRKEPQRRYASVEQLAQDIRRYLDGHPVIARKATFAYRADRFVRRNRAAVAIGTGVLALLVAGLVWNRREAQRARAAEARAERRFNDVRSLARSVIFEIHDSVADLSGATPARKIIVQRALTYLDSLAQESASDPGLSRELAAGYERIGDVQGNPNSANLGDSSGALKSYRKALRLREALAKRQPRDQEIQRELAVTLDSLGDVLGTEGDQAGQLDAYGRSLAVREALVAADPTGAASRRGLATSYHRVASKLVDQGKYREALDMWRKEMEIFEALWRENPNDARAQRNVALSYKYAGGTLERLHDRSSALDLYRKAVALDEARSKADPTNASARIDLSYSYGALGQCLSTEGDLDGAIRSYGKALEIREALVAADPKDVSARLALSKAYQKMGSFLLGKGDGLSARDSCLKAVRIAESVSAEDPSNKNARGYLANALVSLGEAETSLAEARSTPSSGRRGHRQEACSAYERSLAIWRQLRDERALSAQDAGQPEEIAAALRRCQQALARH